MAARRSRRRGRQRARDRGHADHLACTRIRRTAFVLLLAAAVSGALAASGAADLTSRYQAGQQRSSQLRVADPRRVEPDPGLRGHDRLAAGAAGRDPAQRRRPGAAAEHGRPTSWPAPARGWRSCGPGTPTTSQALAAQLRADYETPPPTIVGVVVDSGGFDDLLNGVADLTAIERRNTATAAVGPRRARTRCRPRPTALAAVQARRRRATAAVLVERDTVAQLKVVDRRPRAGRAARPQPGHQPAGRAAPHARPRGADPRPAGRRRRRRCPPAARVAPPGGCANTPFVAHGGAYGFFQAPGTNYSVNEEPIIAARLDQLGKALQLHLIGISGYRTPQHSVEVGGFADDPHTRGLASDTPGRRGRARVDAAGVLPDAAVPGRRARPTTSRSSLSSASRGAQSPRRTSRARRARRSARRRPCSR